MILSSSSHEYASRWRATTFAAAFVLLLVLVSWVMWEGSIAQDRRREREKWDGDWRAMLEAQERQSREIEWLDLAYDELRRERHHATTRP